MRRNIIKFFKQKENYSCAAATFRNLLLLFGKRTTEMRLRYILGTRASGTDENGIKNACEYFDLEYKEIIINKKINDNKIYEILKNHLLEKKKIILCVDDFSHWILVIGVRLNKVIVIDPARSEQTIK
jgi:ABC-type bacteriocin/lantibiotic exporter with double-glycine peptidase domain